MVSDTDNAAYIISVAGNGTFIITLTGFAVCSTANAAEVTFAGNFAAVYTADFCVIADFV